MLQKDYLPYYLPYKLESRYSALAKNDVQVEVAFIDY